jgi:hypothetical protein
MISQNKATQSTQDCPQCAGYIMVQVVVSFYKSETIGIVQIHQLIMFVSKFRYWCYFWGAFGTYFCDTYLLWLSVEGVTNVLLASKQKFIPLLHFQLCYRYPYFDSELAKMLCSVLMKFSMPMKKRNRWGKNFTENTDSFCSMCVHITEGILCVQYTYSDLICNEVG